MAGGPIVLIGIDAEDGGIGGHGPIQNYIDVVNSILANVTNGGTNILVIGGGKNPTDDVTVFWNAIDTAIPGVSVTYVNGAANISAQSFAGFAMLAVVSDVHNTPSGGLTDAENDALATRANDVAAFVNGGGGLQGYSSEFRTNVYGYLAGVGTFVVNDGNYNNIEPTPEGLAIGITNALDVEFWHQTFRSFPSFLDILATNSQQGTPTFGQPAAIGGQQVIVPTCPFILPAASMEQALANALQKTSELTTDSEVLERILKLVIKKEIVLELLLEEACPEAGNGSL